MQVAILGVGGVGQSLASHLLEDERVSSLLLVDKVHLDVRALRRRGIASIEIRRMNVESRGELTSTIRGYDIVVNAALPDYNLSVMRAALDAGTNYMDLAATGPRRPGGLPGILEQLKLHERFRKAGRTALLSMGLDPGMTNVMARDAADRLETIESIRIRSGGTLRLSRTRPAHSFVPLYSKEAFFSDILLRPTVWTDGRLEERELLSQEEDFPFPEPVGVQRTFLVSHEEVKTLPLYLGKPVRHVDFKYALEPKLVQAFVSLHGLGLFDEARRIRVDHTTVPFRRAFLAAFPDVSEVSRYLRGTKCVTVEVEGTRGGMRKVLRSHITMFHEEAWRLWKTTAVYYLTGAAAAIGAIMVAEGATPGPGVYPPEVLEPARMFSEWHARRLPVSRTEEVSQS